MINSNYGRYEAHRPHRSNHLRQTRPACAHSCQQPTQPTRPPVAAPQPQPGKPVNNSNFIDRGLTGVFNNVAPAFPRGQNAVDRLAGDPNSSTLVDLLGKNGLVDAVQKLEKDGPVTVLAPTNQAFQNLAEDQPDLFKKLTDPRNKEALQSILTYHVAGDAFDFRGGQQFDSINAKDGATFSGNPFYGQFQNGEQTINTGTASLSSNGSVVIPVDQVLIPPDFDPSKLLG